MHTSSRGPPASIASSASGFGCRFSRSTDMEPGALVTLDIEKAIAGGRMLARHDGQVVFVWGAIPGERVTARVERIQKHVAYATTVDVMQPSADRRDRTGDWRCGGNVYAHIDYERQR